MGLQFADINADGSLDIVSATFDGSPHVALGSPLGFRAPERLLDAQGQRVLVSSIWDYEKKSHVNLGRSMPDGQAVDDRCISALAFDWDGDGDHDLLLGTYEMGRLFVQMNEGTDAAPKYTGKNIPVMAGGAPLKIPHKMTAPRLVDWDGDGDMDLVTGSFGDSYGGSTGGSVYLVRNEGKAGAPSFAKPEVLVTAKDMGTATAPTGPHAGLYPEVVDWDGDGDLDLIVGAYSMWKPSPRGLTADEKKRLAELDAAASVHEKAIMALQEQQGDAIAKATKGIDQHADPDAWRAAFEKALEPFMAENRKISQKLRPIDRERSKLRPQRERKTFVWYFERKSAAKAVGRR